jgi:hypothetical protein
MAIRISWITTGAALSVAGLVALMGFSNPSTPQGYKGYCVRGGVFSSYHFYGIQQGPTSTGLGFLLSCHNVSITPYTYDEDFMAKPDGVDESVVTLNKLKMQFQLHVTLGVAPDDDSVRDYVEHYEVLPASASDDPDKDAKATYEQFVQPMIKTLGRQEAERFKGMSLKDHQGEIGAHVTRDIQKYLKGTPYRVSAVTVGSIQPPPKLQSAIAEIQRLELQKDQKDAEVGRHAQTALRRIEEAKGTEGAMIELNDGLTDEYLQLQASKLIASAKDATNHTITFIYNGLPMTGTVPGLPSASPLAMPPFAPPAPPAPPVPPARQ